MRPESADRQTAFRAPRTVTVSKTDTHGTTGNRHGFHRPHLAYFQADRGLLHLRSGGATAPAGANLPAVRLRAALSLSAPGVLPWAGRQRGTDSPPGPAPE